MHFIIPEVIWQSQGWGAVSSAILHSFALFICACLSEMLTSFIFHKQLHFSGAGARCSSVVRAFAHGAMGRRIDPSWGWTH